MKNKRKPIYFLFLISCFLFLTSCSFPRIIVLDDPLTPEDHINLGVTYENKGEFENAINEYKKASKSLPAAYLYIGNIYFQQEQFNDAERYYKKAVRGDPENADALNNLSWLYYIKNERLDEAEAFAIKAIELNPSKEMIYRDTLEKIRLLKSQTP